jgi:hypothetical protein
VVSTFIVDVERAAQVSENPAKELFEHELVLKLKEEFSTYPAGDCMGGVTGERQIATAFVIVQPRPNILFQYRCNQPFARSPRKFCRRGGKTCGEMAAGAAAAGGTAGV